MRRFLRTRLALLHKEWRDLRALTLACALLVPIGLISMEYGYLDWRGDFTAGTYVPACIGLFLAVVAADLIAADIATKRARAFAALPTRWASLWVSKLTLLALVGAAFSVWAVVSCSTIYALLAPEQANAQFLEQLGRMPREYLLIAFFGTATVLFWSTILERGFAVVGAAVVTCAVLGGTLPFLHWISPELLPHEDTIMVLLAAVPTVFLAGSLFAFVRAPQHSSSVWRRLAAAAVIPLAIFVPGGAVSAAVLAQRLVVEPYTEGLRITLGHVSPDGHYIAIHAAKQHTSASQRTWLLDLQDGGLSELGELNLTADWDDAWLANGRYVAWTSADFTNRDLQRVYDAETGAILKTRSDEQVASGRGYPFISWATARIEGADLVVTFSDNGQEARLPARHHVTFSRIPGYALHTDSEGVHVHDVAAGTSRVIRAAEQLVQGHFSPTGQYVRTWGKSGYATFDTRSGRRVENGEHGYLWFPGGGSADRFALIVGTGNGVGTTTVFDLETGTQHAALTGQRDNANIDTRVLADGTVIRVTDDGCIEMSDLDGGERRIVYAPREEQ